MQKKTINGYFPAVEQIEFSSIITRAGSNFLKLGAFLEIVLFWYGGFSAFAAFNDRHPLLIICATILYLMYLELNFQKVLSLKRIFLSRINMEIFDPIVYTSGRENYGASKSGQTSQKGEENSSGNASSTAPGG